MHTELVVAMHEHAHELRAAAKQAPHAVATVIGSFEGTGFIVGLRRAEFEQELATLMARHDVQYVVAAHADVMRARDDLFDSLPPPAPVSG